MTSLKDLKARMLDDPEVKAEYDRMGIRSAIHAWIRDDANLTIKMTISPDLIDKLVERIASIQNHNPTTKD